MGSPGDSASGVTTSRERPSPPAAPAARADSLPGPTSSMAVSGDTRIGVRVPRAPAPATIAEMLVPAAGMLEAEPSARGSTMRSTDTDRLGFSWLLPGDEMDDADETGDKAESGDASGCEESGTGGVLAAACAADRADAAGLDFGGVLEDVDVPPSSNWPVWGA